MASKSMALGLEPTLSSSEAYRYERLTSRAPGFSHRVGSGVGTGVLSTSYGGGRPLLKRHRRAVEIRLNAAHRRVRELSATAQRQQLVRDSEGEKGVEVREYEIVDLHTSSYSNETDELQAGQLENGRGHMLDSEAGVKSPEEDSLREKEGVTVVAATDSESPSSTSGLAAGGIVAGALILLAIGGVAGAGFSYKDELNGLIVHANDYIEGHGSFGYVLFVLLYAGLEILAIPAIPLLITAGLLFGNVLGTALVSVAGTIAATVAFLIARYVARDRLLLLAKDNKQFLAIDKAIGEDSFRIVTLLRLSPLLPFSLGNYLYGLTSVQLVPYVAGSWLGMLPGTYAYVSAGALSRSFLADDGSSSAVGPSTWTIFLGVGATVGVAWYITRLAKDALEKAKDD